MPTAMSVYMFAVHTFILLLDRLVKSPKTEAVEAYLSRLKGVFRVEGRPITGSIVIHYDASILDFQSLLAALPVEIPKPAERPSVPAAAGITAKAARIAAGYAFDKAVEHGIPLLLKAVL